MGIQDATSSVTRGFRTFRLFPQDRLEEVRVESRKQANSATGKMGSAACTVIVGLG